MYYFYIVESPTGRVGFGITKNIKERAKQYSSHAGCIMNFPKIYTGNKNHITALEKIYKRDLERLWQVEEWITEWFEDLDAESLISETETIISERHYDIAVLHENFNHTVDL